MSQATELPKPRESSDNAPMLAAWRGHGVLLLQRCEACGRTIFYPRPICPHCQSTRLSWERASGRGRIVCFSRIHRGLAPAFQAEAPIVLAEIALEEGVPMIARVLAADPQAVRSGLAVRLVPPEQAARFSLPTFDLA
jgi:uncharacterized OB-fold protein